MMRREAKFEWAYFSHDGHISLNDLRNLLGVLGYELVGYGKRKSLGENWCFVQIEPRHNIFRPDYIDEDI